MEQKELLFALSKTMSIVGFEYYDREALTALFAPYFDEAVRFAMRTAADGDTVLLSPAAASFDCFVNFEARGNRFRALVTNPVHE